MCFPVHLDPLSYLFLSILSVLLLIFPIRYSYIFQIFLKLLSSIFSPFFSYSFKLLPSNILHNSLHCSLISQLLAYFNYIYYLHIFPSILQYFIQPSNLLSISFSQASIFCCSLLFNTTNVSQL